MSDYVGLEVFNLTFIFNFRLSHASHKYLDISITFGQLSGHYYNY